MREILTPLVKGARGSEEIESTEELLSMIDEVNEKLRVKEENKGRKDAETVNERIGDLPEGRETQSKPPPAGRWSKEREEEKRGREQLQWPP